MFEEHVPYPFRATKRHEDDEDGRNKKQVVAERRRGEARVEKLAQRCVCVREHAFKVLSAAEWLSGLEKKTDGKDGEQLSRLHITVFCLLPFLKYSEIARGQIVSRDYMKVKPAAQEENSSPLFRAIWQSNNKTYVGSFLSDVKSSWW